jgi:hypothetical protein
LGVCRYAGKGQGKVSLCRQLWNLLRPSDVLLGDRLMANWAGILMLQQRGVDFVGRLNKAKRVADFRKGIRLGKTDHLVCWKKPTLIRSVDRETYSSLPDSLTIREVRFQVEQLGFRTRSVVVVTTLLDPCRRARKIWPHFTGPLSRKIANDPTKVVIESQADDPLGSTHHEAGTLWMGAHGSSITDKDGRSTTLATPT